MNQVYSFIDVVALEPVRTRFAAGEALVVFDADLDEILWANGAGAKALGFQAIDEAMGAANPLPAIARRQIAATPGFPHVQPNRTIVVRSAATLLSRLSRLALEPVTLPDAEVAVLVSFLDLAAEPDTAWQQAIAGFAVDDHAAAILDDGGKALAATSSFEEAGFHDADLAALAASAAHARGQVAKRRLPSRRGLLPAGIAKLGDDPALFLLIAVSEGAEPGDTPASVPTSEMPASDAADDAATMEEPAIPAAAHVAEGSAGRKGSLRFVWRTDAQGCFSAISPEFLEAMGSDEGAVIGRSFREIAAALGFDEDGEITGLLERRDTWSGRSVLWPLPGNGSMRAPVDLAALPVYDRNRVFEGFRGFGVARFIDAVAADPVAELAKSTADPQAVPTIDDEAPGEVEEDPFQGEPPVLVSTEAANGRPSSPSSTIEKVVRLAAHRQALAERAALSSSERIAFQEIGHRLKAADEAAPESEKVMSIVTDVPQQPSAEASAPLMIPVEPSADPAPAIVPQDSDVNAAGSEPRRDAQPADEPAAEENEDVTARAAVEGSWPRATKIPLADRVLELPPSARMEEPAQSVAHDGSVDEDGGDTAAALEEDAVSPSLDGGATPAEVAAMEEERGESGDEVSPTELVETTDASPAPFVGIEPLAADAPVALPPTVDHDVQAADSLLEDIPDLQSEPAFGDDEEVSGRFGEQPNVTKLPDAERELIDALPIALIIHAGDRLDFANREFFSLTGFDSLAAISAAGGLEALFPAPVGKETAAKDRRLFVRRFDGEQIPVHAHLQSVPWGGGKSLMLSLRRAEGEPQSEWSALQDLHDTDIPQNPENLGDNVTRLPLTLVTPPQQSVPEVASVDEDALSRTQALLDEMRAIIDTATDGVVLITPDSRIRSLSQPAEALFGVDSAGVEGQPFSSLFAIESQRAIKEYLHGLTDHGVASVLNDGREVIGREKQGGFIPLFITIGRLPAQGGFCAVLREITQWKRAEEELTQARAQAERSSSQKSDFLARVSHEIRTPLNAIIGFSELMMEERFGPVGNERYREYLRDINRSGTHVLDLVNDLLDISKIEAGEQELSYTAVSLNDALAEAVAIMQPQANRERVIIRSSFASRLPDVVADLRSIRQIALNLLSNAVRYTQAGGQVIVSTVYEPHGEVILRIRDTGVGMSSAEIDQALRPFKQINALRRARGDGTGLGLPLTKAMVEANRARFVIDSRPGDGTLVEITFPSTRVLAD